MDHAKADQVALGSVNIQSDPEVVISDRRYNTRPTNETHPARKFGLEKRTMGDISADADRKRAEKEEALLRKEEEVNAKNAALQAKIAQLAALEQRLNERAESEVMDVDDAYLDHIHHASNPVEVSTDSDIVMDDATVGAQSSSKKRAVKVSTFFPSSLGSLHLLCLYHI